MNKRIVFDELVEEVKQYKKLLSANPDLLDAFSPEEQKRLDQIITSVDAQQAKMEQMEEMQDGGPGDGDRKKKREQKIVAKRREQREQARAIWEQQIKTPLRTALTQGIASGLNAQQVAMALQNQAATLLNQFSGENWFDYFNPGRPNLTNLMRYITIQNSCDTVTFQREMQTLPDGSLDLSSGSPVEITPTVPSAVNLAAGGNFFVG